MRTTLLSAAVFGLVMVTGAGWAQAKKVPARPAAKAAARSAANASARAGATAPAKPVKRAAAKAGVTGALETCEFQVRTRSKVGFRGTATYWVKGPWVREEKRSGGGMELILVSNDKGLFIRNKHSNYWFRYPDEMGVRLRQRILGGPIGDVKAFLKETNAKYLGQEKVEGVLCNAWSYRFKGADDKFRLWTDLKNTRPIRMERDHLVRGTRKRDVLVVEYLRYHAGQQLPDSLFRVPANEKVHDMREALKPENLRKYYVERQEAERKKRLEQRPGAQPQPAPATPEKPEEKVSE